MAASAKRIGEFASHGAAHGWAPTRISFPITTPEATDIVVATWRFHLCSRYALLNRSIHRTHSRCPGCSEGNNRAIGHYVSRAVVNRLGLDENALRRALAGDAKIARVRCNLFDRTRRLQVTQRCHN